MRGRGTASPFRRPSNVLLLVGILLSITFFTFCYFTMRSGQANQPYDDIDDPTPARRQKRELMRDRPARFQQREGKSLEDVQQEQQEALKRYKEKYGRKEETKEQPPARREEKIEEEPAYEKQAEEERVAEPPKREEREEPARERSRKDEDVATKQKNLPGALDKLPPLPVDHQKPKSEERLRIAIISAFKGDRYNYMAKLSGETKKKYAQMHGYTFIEDNEMIPDDATWNQRSAIRTKCFQAHMNDYDYMFWTDVDIFFTNPFVTIEEIIQAGRGAHVICSKDWGNRQLNPGSMIVKSSDFTRKFIIEWEDAIARVTDDLRAFQEVMKEHPDYEGRKIRFISQAILNPYHDVETQNGKLSPKPLPDPNGHELWTPEVLLVHIVNCLRTSRGDCHLLADHYYRIAEKKFEQAGYPLIPYLDE